MSPRSWRLGLAATAALASTLVLAGCNGPNLFEVGNGVVSDVGPVVQISTPAAGTSVPSGQAVGVTASVASTTGIKSVEFEGITISGSSSTLAYSPVTMNLSTLPKDTILQASLTPTTNQQSDSVYFVVTATDTAGNVGADTVGVTVGALAMSHAPANGRLAQASGAGFSMQVAAADVAIGARRVMIAVEGAVDRTFHRRDLNGRAVAWRPSPSPAGAARTARC